MLSICTTTKQVDKQHEVSATFVTGNKKMFLFFISGEENSPGWLCGEDEGKTMAPLWCPLLACHMPVFATKSPERKVTPLPPLHNKQQQANLNRDTSLVAFTIDDQHRVASVPMSVNTGRLGLEVENIN